ncbi:MAG: polysaccharide biosynthesis protein [Kiritimatiellae bacterium]|nr:polysaccharide biosynthesis protein [Kiritimatiellia bacterium]
MNQLFKAFLIKHRRLLYVLMHAVFSALIFCAAFWIRFEGNIPSNYFAALWNALPLAVVCRLGAMILFRLHIGLWRYTSVDDLVRIIKSNTLSTIILVTILFFVTHLKGFPRSVFVIDWLLGIVVFGGKRLVIRLFKESLDRKRDQTHLLNTLIAGAGDAGALALRLLRGPHRQNHCVIGFLDDDPGKQGMMISGCLVLGKLKIAPRLVKEREVREILIAMPSASKEVIRSLVESCAGLSVRFRILPAVADLVTGMLKAQSIREVQVEDLLGRDPILLNRENVHSTLHNECVMVTGAAGSIGSEIARQVATCHPKRLVLVDIAESPLFEIDREIAAKSPQTFRSAVIADIRNVRNLDEVMERYGPDRIFHAAAYKHVPLMEDHPIEAANNNVLGTLRLASAAARHGVKSFIMISTDKAVRPGNIMGCTKRIAERVVSGMNGPFIRTVFVAVRFGNVLGSNGSVIPIFRRQIEHGGPVTVTHPDMTRFFMTIPEAVELVLQAGLSGQAGDIFVLDMGQQVRIKDLAENLIRLSGLIPGKDIEIVYTGLRPGEKLSEELFSESEDLVPTGVPKLNVLRRKSTASANHEELHQKLALLETAVDERNETEVRRLLAELASA